MAAGAGQTKHQLSFGPFNLVVTERLLTRNGSPVELSARALDVLIAFLSSPNEVVSKEELMSRVWPDTFVEESNLRVQMAGLRRALGDGKDGARYIVTIAGRGYCFVAPVSRVGVSNDRASVALEAFPHSNLPGRLIRMVGRDEDVHRISAELKADRFVTIVGPGGVGKTTVAVAIGHDLMEPFAGAVVFTDFSMVSDPNLVGTVIAAMLALSLQSPDATPALMSYLCDKRMLLILDTCEHLIDAVAALAERIFAGAPQVYILATSREALRIDGERIFKLDSLACPPDDSRLTA